MASKTGLVHVRADNGGAKFARLGNRAGKKVIGVPSSVTWVVGSKEGGVVPRVDDMTPTMDEAIPFPAVGDRLSASALMVDQHRFGIEHDPLPSAEELEAEVDVVEVERKTLVESADGDQIGPSREQAQAPVTAAISRTVPTDGPQILECPPGKAVEGHGVVDHHAGVLDGVIGEQ